MKNDKNTKSFNEAVRPLVPQLRQTLKKLSDREKANVQEIRLRSDKAVCIVCCDKSFFIDKNSCLTETPTDTCLITNHSDILNSFHSICNYSVYSHQNEIRNGFVTFAGGHRVGVAGTAVINDGKISGIRDIFSLNIRIAKEVIGVADDIIRKLNRDLSGVLIAGRPACGKTTLLRDIARTLSFEKKVCVVDERGELASVYLGVAQNDLGNCDILTGYPKGRGIVQAIRCLSPNLIVCDEVGTKEEAIAIEEGLNAGVGVIASVHCNNMEELRNRVQMKRLLETKAFNRVILMGSADKPGYISGVYKIGEFGV